MFLGVSDSDKEKSMSTITNFITDESGATAVEYGIMIAAISVIIITVVFDIGRDLKPGFDTVSNELSDLSN